jgi:hypothetical protein
MLQIKAFAALKLQIQAGDDVKSIPYDSAFCGDVFI